VVLQLEVGLSTPHSKKYVRYEISQRASDLGRFVGNIRMDLRDIGWNSMGWIDLAQDRDQWKGLVNTVMKLRVP
jgi:hypothetical protein